MNQKSIKMKIRKEMLEKNIDIMELSKRSGINIIKLIFTLYCPYVKIRLIKSLCICKALNIKLSNLF